MKDKKGLLTKEILLAACLASAGLFAPGCATPIRELPAEERKTGPQGEEFAFSRELVLAFMRNDAKGFLKHLPEEVRGKFDEKKFAASRKSVLESLGEPISFRYVTSLELTTFTPFIWKIRFQRTDPRNGKKFTSEALFRVITGKLNGKPVLIGFQFL